MNSALIMKGFKEQISFGRVHRRRFVMFSCVHFLFSNAQPFGGLPNLRDAMLLQIIGAPKLGSKV